MYASRLALALCAGIAPLSSLCSADVTIDVGRGPITVTTPASYVPGEPTPLVLLLHGYTWSANVVENYMQLGAFADQYGFLYCVPEGTPDSQGHLFWNASDACCNFDNSTVDDSAYLRALIDEIINQLSVDTRRVFIVGQSNGGFMAYRMACDHSDIVAAIASLAGASPLVPCAPAHPVSVLQIHGTNDGTIQYGGGSFMGLPPYPAATVGTEQWAVHAGCSLVSTVLPAALDLEVNLPGFDTDITRYSTGCAAGGAAELWTINGGGHIPILTAEFRVQLLDFLFDHPKPGVELVRGCTPAVPNSTGLPAVIEAAGSDIVNHQEFTLMASALPPGEFGYFLASLSTGFVSGPGGSAGNLCLSGTIARFAQQVQSTGTTGTIAISVDINNIPANPLHAITPGETWHFQAWYRDGLAQPATSNFTDEIAVTFQ